MIGVIVYHFFPKALHGGLVGVDIFFVISGYLISLILISQPRLDASVLKTFYARRVKRIFPALLAVMLCSFGFGWIALYADEFKELGKHIMASAGFASNLVYMQEAGYFDVAAEQKPLLHLWSLGVEEQFYIIWPLLLILLGQRERQRLAIKILWLLSFAGNLYLSYRNVDAAYYLPFTRFWEILTGAMLAFSETKPDGARRGGGGSAKGFSASAGLILLFGSMSFVRGEANFPGWQALIPVLGAYLVIRNASSRTTRLILANRPMVYIGLISYPLYLWHWPVISYLKITELQPTATQKGIGIGLTVLLAIITYRFLEKPIRHRKGWTTAVLLILMTTMAAIGHNIYRRNGHDYRQVNYEVYKRKAIKTASAWLGLTERNVSASSGLFEFDRHRFESLHPEYALQLRQLALRMKADNAFYEQIKSDFQLINQSDFGSNGTARKQGESQLRIVIIGDSHAENLYSALKLTHLQHEFTCFTASGCTPILSRYKNEDNRCKLLLNKSRDFLKQQGADLVILAARWPESYARVAEDIAYYKTVSAHVAIAGPSLTFTSDVSKVMLRYTDGDDIIEHVNRFIDTTKFHQNAEMKAFAAEQRVGFIDKLQTLSSDGICRITATGQELFIFDSAHLTRAGAVEVGQILLLADVLRALMK